MGRAYFIDVACREIFQPNCVRVATMERNIGDVICSIFERGPFNNTPSDLQECERVTK